MELLNRTKVRLITDKTDYLQGLADRLRLRKDPNNDLEWNDIALYMSEQTGAPVAKEYCRKGAPLFYLFDEAGWVRNPGNDDGAESTYLRQKLEADKAAIKARDERNELARIQRELARRESVVDLVRDIMHEEIVPISGYVHHHVDESPVDLVVHLSDIHGGLFAENCFNTYNIDVMKQRIHKYIDKIHEIVERHRPQNCYVMLGGDQVSGIIHTELRIEAQVDVIKQLKVVSIAISEFVAELSRLFDEVEVYSVSGNHSRVTANKKDHLKGENLDSLIPFYLTASLKEYENVCIHEENAEESVAFTTIRGNYVAMVHGDKDTPDNVVQKLTMMFGVKPNIVLMGHRHRNALTSVYDSRVYESGCISGSDGYCLDHRLRNKPEQTVLVVNDLGVDCAYNVVLD